ncbi:acyl-CoA dehydrogenase family protein [Leucobacter coleopterorum]|uniref:acyl-CoA dehydrogenase family protein n=1 Tax=Leucobacter coleopterorum TaxID=2714933 RepID=UPI0019813E54|nr:acyl-CoA dehydrogenase family protein [Leucobacter coleopterorum]
MMEFAYTNRLSELRERARSLANVLETFELECEENNGLSAESHATIKQAVLDHQLNAINTPVEYGGTGLSVLEQAVVQEQLGRVTGVLWDTVWRPANPLAHATPSSASAT